MNTDEWATIITKITPNFAEPIDDILERHDVRFSDGGTNHFPTGDWHHGKKAFKNPATVCIAVRVSDDSDDRFELSMKLAALAMEKEMTPIIFYRGRYSGLEKFGFRVEKITGTTEREQQECEEQLKRFWNISVVI